MMARSDRQTLETIVHVPINGCELEGKLVIPQKAKGLVIFAHGSSSSRHSPRNKFVAKRLHNDLLATLLINMLSDEEDSDYQNRFDIPMLARRLTRITDWARHGERTKRLPIGYFGASTGAAAAIIAAAGNENTVKAIVSRGGRVDLAYDTISALKVPTLFIVGQEDFGVHEANEEVFLNLKCKKELSVIPHATHLFEEPGTLDRVAELASRWFNEHLRV